MSKSTHTRESDHLSDDSVSLAPIVITPTEVKEEREIDLDGHGDDVTEWEVVEGQCLPVHHIKVEIKDEPHNDDTQQDHSISSKNGSSFEIINDINDTIARQNVDLKLDIKDESSNNDTQMDLGLSCKEEGSICSFCRESFTSAWDLLQHNRLVHYFRCKDCGNISSSLKELNKHMVSSHQCQIVSSMTPLTSKAYTCRHCRKTFPSLKHLQHHETVHLKYECEHCNKACISLRQLRSHNLAYHNFKCSLCSEVFIYTKHLNLHKDNDHFRCEKCRKFYASSDDLYNHKISEH